VDHHLGGLWGQIASQLIQFLNAGDEPWPGWGKVCERARQGRCGLGNGRGWGVLDRDVDWPAGLSYGGVWRYVLAAFTQQLSNHPDASLNVLKLGQKHP
jgi:hypothetical protein